MLRHDICVYDAREAGRDSFDISLHGSTLPSGLQDDLGLGRILRRVAGAPRMAIELRQLMLRAAMRRDERPRRMIPARIYSRRIPGPLPVDFYTA